MFTPAEFESLIAREYIDDFHKFFDANNPLQAKAPTLSTPTVLNIVINSTKLLQLCGEKLRQAGGTIWDETEFLRAEVRAFAILPEYRRCDPDQLQWLKPTFGYIPGQAVYS